MDTSACEVIDDAIVDDDLDVGMIEDADVDWQDDFRVVSYPDLPHSDE